MTQDQITNISKLKVELKSLEELEEQVNKQLAKALNACDHKLPNGLSAVVADDDLCPECQIHHAYCSVCGKPHDKMNSDETIKAQLAIAAAFLLGGQGMAATGLNPKSKKVSPELN